MVSDSSSQRLFLGVDDTVFFQSKYHPETESLTHFGPLVLGQWIWLIIEADGLLLSGSTHAKR
jgi:hypothetical protein